jgi:hypothetical protein
MDLNMSLNLKDDFFFINQTPYSISGMFKETIFALSTWQLKSAFVKKLFLHRLQFKIISQHSAP